MQKRVYLHHFGLSAANDQDLDASYESWLAQRCLLEKSQSIDSWQLQGYGPDLTPEDVLMKSVERSMSGFNFDVESTAVIVSSSRGNMGLTLEAHSEYQKSGKIDRKTSPQTTPASLATTLSRTFSLGGACQFVSASCNSSLQALISGAGHISMGVSKQVLVSGFEVPHLFLTKQLERLGVLQPLYVIQQDSEFKPGSTNNSNNSYPCRPFHLDRKGMVLGYGAASVVLSEKPSDIELVGLGSATLSKTIAGLDRDGFCLQRAFSSALQMAKLGPSDIDAIFSHGSGTKVGDRAEANAYKAIWQNQDQKPRVVGHKWLWGHAIGASGLMALVTAKKVFDHQSLAGFPYEAGELGEDFVASRVHSRGGRLIQNIAVVNLGFSGVASVAILSYKKA